MKPIYEKRWVVTKVDDFGQPVKRELKDVKVKRKKFSELGACLL